MIVSPCLLKTRLPVPLLCESTDLCVTPPRILTQRGGGGLLAKFVSPWFWTMGVPARFQVPRILILLAGAQILNGLLWAWASPLESHVEPIWDLDGPEWPCMIEIAWVDLGRPYPGSYKQEILANRGQKVCSRPTGVIQSCTANGLLRT